MGGPYLRSELKIVPDWGIVQDINTLNISKVPGNSRDEAQHSVGFKRQSAIDYSIKIIYFIQITKAMVVDIVIYN